MSRKKLKGFDPGNNNKAARDNYQRLQEGNTLRDLAPRPVKDENRLSGAHRRFAMQLLVSQKLDARDKARARGEKNIVSIPDYRAKLEEQVRAKSEAQRKQQEKAARRQQQQQQQPATTPSPAPPPASSHRAVSLSKSIEQQRQSKQAKQEHQKTKAELKADLKAAAAAADADAAVAAVASKEDTDMSDEQQPKGQPKITFTTEMRPGESFRSYQARLVQEKSRLMNAEVVEGKKKLSERKKRKLGEKELKRKERKGLAGLDEDGQQETPIERRVRKEREAKDASDLARGEEPEGVPAAKRARIAGEGPKKEFAGVEEVMFGEVAERPPTLTLLPKSKTLSNRMDASRIRAGLLLLQKQKGKKPLDAEEKEEWIRKQEDLERRTLASEEVKERELQALRAASIAAYKEGKKRKREEDAKSSATASGLEGVGTKKKDEVYIKKRVLKKQARNRERMKQFKDNADLDLDMEIEMADDLD